MADRYRNSRDACLLKTAETLAQAYVATVEAYDFNKDLNAKSNWEPW